MNTCSQCGICCKLFLINLNKKEWLSGWYKTQLKEFFTTADYKYAQKYGGNILNRKKDGSCVYLRDNLCSIHTRRPKACRNFSCLSKSDKYKGMIEMIKRKSL